MFLNERYQVQNSLARHGIATLYRGRDTYLDRDVAIKMFQEGGDSEFIARFQHTAKTALTLQHPNIVQLYDVGQVDGKPYLIMELVEGTDLRRHLRSHGGVLDIDQAISIAHAVALGLYAAYRHGITRSDVSPQHILIGHDGSTKLTAFNMGSGSLATYLAPEQIKAEIITSATNVYATGIILYLMLTGRLPFDGDTPVSIAMQHIQELPIPPSQLNPSIPPSLEEVILCCLEKLPAMRYRNGSHLAYILKSLTL